MANKVNVDNSNPLFNCLPQSEQKRPWLVLTHEELEKQTFYSVSEAQYFEKLIPEMQKKWVSQASYGWLLLVDNDTLDCCLMNPKTMEKIHLPRVLPQVYKCVLSRPPIDPNCHILLVGTKSILFCRLGDDQFIERPNAIGGGYMMTATNFQGKIYAWISVTSCRFVIVNFEKGDLVLKNLMKKDGQQCRLPCRELTYGPYCDDHLIECCGKLLLVHMICCSSHYERAAGYRIFQIDMETMECEELDSIGNRAIFLGKLGSMAISCSSKETGVEKDSIYYFNPVFMDKLLYIYHIPYEMEESLILCPKVNVAIMSWIVI